MIKKGTFILPGKPWIIGKERAIAPCGCTIWVGLRADNKEVATSADNCTPDHEAMMIRFNDLMRESLENPTTRPLIDVVDELLEKAYWDQAKEVAMGGGK